MEGEYEVVVHVVDIDEVEVVDIHEVVVVDIDEVYSGSRH